MSRDYKDILSILCHASTKQSSWFIPESVSVEIHNAACTVSVFIFPLFLKKNNQSRISGPSCFEHMLKLSLKPWTVSKSWPGSFHSAEFYQLLIKWTAPFPLKTAVSFMRKADINCWLPFWKIFPLPLESLTHERFAGNRRQKIEKKKP